MMKITGKSFDALLLQAKDEVQGTIYGETITRTFRDQYSKWRDHLPPVDSPHPIYTLCKLKTYSAQQIGAADLCDVQLNYAQDELPSTTPIPPVEIVENGSTETFPIQQHPDFNDDAKFPDADKIYLDGEFIGFVKGSPFEGKTGFVVGIGDVSITTFSLARPEPVQPLLGKRGDPGNGLGNVGHWLILTGNVSKRGAFWARTLVYRYSSEPVNTTIYAAAS